MLAFEPCGGMEAAEIVLKVNLSATCIALVEHASASVAVVWVAKRLKCLNRVELKCCCF
jgi:hypothetical protein